MSRKRLSTTDRANRQKSMMALRNWMTENDVPRKDVAELLGITVGHLSTLINANRTPSQEQVDTADTLVMMGSIEACRFNESTRQRPTVEKAPVVEKQPVADGPARRPLTKDEADLVAAVVQAWIDGRKDATPEALVEVVRAVSAAIRG